MDMQFLGQILWISSELTGIGGRTGSKNSGSGDQEPFFNQQDYWYKQDIFIVKPRNELLNHKKYEY